MKSNHCIVSLFCATLAVSGGRVAFAQSEEQPAELPADTAAGSTAMPGSVADSAAGAGVDNAMPPATTGAQIPPAGIHSDAADGSTGTTGMGGVRTLPGTEGQGLPPDAVAGDQMHAQPPAGVSPGHTDRPAAAKSTSPEATGISKTGESTARSYDYGSPASGKWGSGAPGKRSVGEVQREMKAPGPTLNERQRDRTNISRNDLPRRAEKGGTMQNDRATSATDRAQAPAAVPTAPANPSSPYTDSPAGGVNTVK